MTTLAPLQANEFRVTFPTYYAPKYANPNGGVEAVQTDTRISIKAEVEGQEPVSLRSTDANVTHEAGGRTVSVTKTGALQTDFVLCVQYPSLEAPMATTVALVDTPDDVVVSGSDFEVVQHTRYATLLSCTPRYPFAKQPVAFSCMVDQSGSMGGDKINNARAALKSLLLTGLEPGDWFNLIGFGDRQREHIAWGPYTNSRKTEANATIDNEVITDMGGTETAAALHFCNQRFAAAAAIPANLQRVIILLTDADTGAFESVLESIDPTIPILVMVIGQGASLSMGDEIAQASGGEMFEAKTGEDIVKVMNSMLDAARQPMITEVNVEAVTATGAKLPVVKFEDAFPATVSVPAPDPPMPTFFDPTTPVTGIPMETSPAPTIPVNIKAMSTSLRSDRFFHAAFVTVSTESTGPAHLVGPSRWPHRREDRDVHPRLGLVVDRGQLLGACGPNRVHDLQEI